MAVRNIIKIDEDLCTGCGQCIIGCAEGALELIDGKARLVAEKYCDGLGACLGECPTGALEVIQREADEFDEEAVEELLRTEEHARRIAAAKGGNPAPKPSAKPGGCPSAGLMTMTPCQSANVPGEQEGTGSNLTHWPVQIRLVPPDAPFLKNADLLLAADCVAVAFPQFHSKMLKGRKVMMGCPKFDDGQMYIDRLTELFKANDLKSVTVAQMEVPCCSAMTGIVKEALKRSGKAIPATTVVIARNGAILGKQPIK